MSSRRTTKMPPKVFICWTTGCPDRKEGKACLAGAMSAETVIGAPVLSAPPTFGNLKLKAMELLREGWGWHPRSNPDIHEILVGQQFADRQLAPNFPLRIGKTLLPPKRHHAVRSFRREIFRPLQAKHARDEQGGVGAITGANQQQARIGILDNGLATTENRKIGNGIQIAANVGDPDNPWAGQGDRRQLRSLDDLAPIAQIDQPGLTACLDTEPGGSPLAHRRLAEAGRQVLLEIAQPGLAGNVLWQRRNALQQLLRIQGLDQIIDSPLAQAPDLVGFLPLGGAYDDRDGLGLLVAG